MSTLSTSLVFKIADAATPHSAIEAAYDACGRSIYRFLVVRLRGDGHAADDIMQQLWLKALAGAVNVPAAELEFWLRGVARNLLYSHWRRAASRPEAPLADPKLAGELAERMTREELPAALLERREVRDQLLLALTELPAADQELIVGYYFDGLSQVELGARFEIGARAVEARLYRARLSLREKLKHLG